MGATGHVQYRLGGNIYETRYYLAGNNVGEYTNSLRAIFAALRQIQTQDVEYLRLFFVDDSTRRTENLEIAPGEVYGAGGTGGDTAPAITFLEFSLNSTLGRGGIKSRVRGFEANATTDLSSFNARSSGEGDPDVALSGGGASFPRYWDYLMALAQHAVTGRGDPLSISSRVNIGAKRATSRL